jgi:O-antigen/teichoic acid export membrane protein
MTGTAIAQAIPIAISPILTRIYTPNDFGLLSLFISITAILGSIANGRYELAIMLPEKDDEAINIAALSLLIAATFSVILLIIILIFNQGFSDLLGNKKIGFWLYFVPFVVLMTGLFNVLNYLNTRKQLYKDIAKANIYKSVGMTSVQLGLGFAKLGATGLISGQIVAQIISNYRLAKNAKKNYNIQAIKKSAITNLAKRYSDFPKFSMSAILANSLAYNLTNILISIYYNIATLGFYSLGQRLLGMPAALVGSSIGQVYFQEATIEKNKTGKAVNTFNKTSKKLFLLSIVFFTPLFFLLPIIFEIVFGKEWRVAGEYAQITLPFVASQFVVSAVSTTNSIFEKQKVSLIWQLSLLSSSLLTIFITHKLSIQFEKFLFFYASINLVHYIILWTILYRVVQGEKVKYNAKK